MTIRTNSAAESIRKLGEAWLKIPTETREVIWQASILEDLGFKRRARQLLEFPPNSHSHPPAEEKGQ